MSKQNPGNTSKNRIHLIDGEKGGVGKTFICLVIMQYFLDKSLLFTPVESDRSNPDVARRNKHLDFKFAIFSEDDRKTRADELIEYAKKNPVVISLPSQVANSLNNWLDDAVDVAKENNIEFVRWFISSGKFETLNLFKESIDRHGNNMPYIFVKNYGVKHAWHLFKPDGGIRGEVYKLIDKYKVKVIELDELKDVDSEIIEEKKVPFGEVKDSKFFADRSMSISRVQKFLKKAYESFESTGLFP